jgi:hypothetical protein
LIKTTVEIFEGNWFPKFCMFKHPGGFGHESRVSVSHTEGLVLRIRHFGFFFSFLFGGTGV